MGRSLTPEEKQRLRCKFRTEREFAEEVGVVDPDEVLSRRDLVDRLSRLTHYEKNALQARLSTRLRSLNELMAEDHHEYDTPQARHEDLPAGVRLPGFYHHVNTHDLR